MDIKRELSAEDSEGCFLDVPLVGSDSDFEDSDDAEPSKLHRAFHFMGRQKLYYDIPQCKDCTCPFLKYTKEQMERNPVQFNETLESVLFITPQDIDNARRKWRKIKNDSTTFGTLIMITLLNDAPETAVKYGVSAGVLIRGRMVYDQRTVQSGRKIADLICHLINNLDEPGSINAFAYHDGWQISLLRPKGLQLTEKDFKAVHSALIKAATTYYKMNNTPEIIESIKKISWIVLGMVEDAVHWNDFGKR